MTGSGGVNHLPWVGEEGFSNKRRESPQDTEVGEGEQGPGDIPGPLL